MKTPGSGDLLADLLVVGASFAGVACAIEAARAGLAVTLIERKHDAGEKLHTTGIVVKEAADELARLGYLPSELIRPIRGVRCTARDSTVLRSTRPATSSLQPTHRI